MYVVYKEFTIQFTTQYRRSGRIWEVKSKSLAQKVITLLSKFYIVQLFLFYVFPTVHHSIGYFLEPTLMHTSI